MVKYIPLVVEYSRTVKGAKWKQSASDTLKCIIFNHENSSEVALKRNDKAYAWTPFVFKRRP